ncbi:30S ribosomal protein S18 [Mycoplasmopsis bovis]|uniref:30S ribosomal protein S18 n=1 Tax=Mycoplasmopsis bovis TaxID=28903 RepID=UPI0012603D8E|nr:30S ribosomal protein S18 [Mycoplasmopsis bovis]MBT1367564.1 30S ribosomal protein S18 [Mycoplasmopsis bovis]MBT1369102.1 30S ribosomal protein S18 [Mycoplasmopsis bovis]MBT1420563.1 30S ribosomal protein S18 [Mycoplasmopsis bovis]MCA8841171.1 30S ribosomal protein S18 [Mycoplasmopsis bovis]
MANFKKIKKGRNLRRKCELCETNIEYVDYKNVEFITKFISGIGQIKPHASTGTCARHQRKVANAIKRARFMALIPYTKDKIRVLAPAAGANAAQPAAEKAKKEATPAQ